MMASIKVARTKVSSRHAITIHSCNSPNVQRPPVTEDWPRQGGERPEPDDDGHYDPRDPISRGNACPDNNERDDNERETSKTSNLGHRIPGTNAIDAGGQQI